MRLERRPHYVVQPEVEAGDVLFFTEALIHGTAPWTASHERRALLFLNDTLRPFPDPTIQTN